MPDPQRQRVTVRLVTKHEFTADVPDVDPTPSIALDERRPHSDASTPHALGMLGAAIGHRLSASVVNCLNREHVTVDALTIETAAYVTRHHDGCYRIAGIHVELVPSVPPPESPALGRAEAGVGDSAIIAEGLGQGIR
jgi:hypothetical protein